jgi:hypothetical protein
MQQQIYSPSDKFWEHSTLISVPHWVWKLQDCYCSLNCLTVNCLNMKYIKLIHNSSIVCLLLSSLKEFHRF